jgi:hypothetical protein
MAGIAAQVKKTAPEGAAKSEENTVLIVIQCRPGRRVGSPVATPAGDVTAASFDAGGARAEAWVGLAFRHAGYEQCPCHTFQARRIKGL